MKKGKWVRLGMGVCFLASIFIFPGTMGSGGHCDPWLCFTLETSLAELTHVGYVEIQNNTIYNIVVRISGPTQYGPYKIKTNPNFIRFSAYSGAYRVAIYVCTPTPDQEQVYYMTRKLTVPRNLETTRRMIVTVPLGYIPVPKH